MKSGQSPEEFSKGILVLLFKKGYAKLLKNYRPLTLLNVDYKILMKVFAERIKPSIANIIDLEQNGFVPGR